MLEDGWPSIKMEGVLTGELINRFGVFRRFQRHLEVEVGAMAFAFRWHEPSLTRSDDCTHDPP